MKPLLQYPLLDWFAIALELRHPSGHQRRNAQSHTGRFHGETLNEVPPIQPEAPPQPSKGSWTHTCPT